jgi:hypothetical protein
LVSPALNAREWKLLIELAGGFSLPVSELPYTEEFEHLYAAFSTAAQNSMERHEVWLAVLQIGAHQSVEHKEQTVPVDKPFKRVEALTKNSDVGVQSRSGPTNSAIEDSTSAGTLFDLQPWHVPPLIAVPTAHEVERQQLLKALADSNLIKMEQKVAYILQRYPETRDSDTALAIRYWTAFQSDVLEQWERLDLDVLFDLDQMGTISRIRRHNQNSLRLFTASIYTRQQRDELQMEFSQYLAIQRPVDAEIRFYLDETGNEAGKRYLGIAGICAMNWKQYEKHWSALADWRLAQGWTETIHFVDTGTTLQPKALAMLAQLQRRQSGLLFVGYAIPSRGSTHQTKLSLFIQIIIDSLHHMNALNCLSTPRSLTVIKEAEDGFDELFLQQMGQYLSEQIAREFPTQVVFKKIEAVPKGREVLLECADLVAGGMQRRALYGGRNPKDALAEAVFNVTGFEDPRDNGTVFKAYPA